MRPIRVVGLYFFVVFLGGALVAPWLYGLVQAAGGVLPFFESLASKPFPRYVSRCLLVLALAGIWPFLRATELGSWRALGLGRRADGTAQLLWGFALGLGSLAGMVVLAVAASGRELNHEHGPGSVLWHVINAGLAAMVVAPLEEIFFRGALFGALRKTFHWSMALVLSSSIYALLHFLERPGAMKTVGWSSGFSVLVGMVEGFGEPGKLIPGFLNLTLAGMILGLAYFRSGSLYFSIGLHAGWIFWLKTYGFITREAAEAPRWLFGTGKLIDGWLAFLVLALVLVLLSRFMVQEDPQTGWRERRLFS